MSPQSGSVLDGEIIGLDLGMSRTGVARVSTYARLPEPLSAIKMSDDFVDQIASIIKEHRAVALVLGMPRNLEGEDTEQTIWCKSILKELQKALKIPVFTIDEAVTTKAAEGRALPGQEIDSVAACIIVEDFLSEALRGAIADVSIAT